MSTIGNPIPATNEGMDLDDDSNMVDSAITSYEGNINALNSVNISMPALAGAVYLV